MTGSGTRAIFRYSGLLSFCLFLHFPLSHSSFFLFTSALLPIGMSGQNVGPQSRNGHMIWACRNYEVNHSFNLLHYWLNWHLNCDAASSNCLSKTIQPYFSNIENWAHSALCLAGEVNVPMKYEHLKCSQSLCWRPPALHVLDVSLTQVIIAFH